MSFVKSRLFVRKQVFSIVNFMHRPFALGYYRPQHFESHAHHKEYNCGQTLTSYFIFQNNLTSKRCFSSKNSSNLDDGDSIQSLGESGDDEFFTLRQNQLKGWRYPHLHKDKEKKRQSIEEIRSLVLSLTAGQKMQQSHLMLTGSFPI